MAKKLAFDRILFTAIVLLVGLGLVMVYSASTPMARAQGHAVNPLLVYVMPIADAARYGIYEAVGCTSMAVGFLLLTPLAIVATEVALVEVANRKA